MAYKRKINPSKESVLDKNSVGYAIRKYRRMRNITAKELAEKIGVNETNLTNTERNVCIPKLDKRKKIAEALEIPLYLLLVDYDLGIENQPIQLKVPISEYSTKELLKELERRCGL